MHFVDTIDDLRKLNTTGVRAHVAATGAFFNYSPTSTATDDGSTVVKPSSITNTLFGGRWLAVTIVPATVVGALNTTDHLTLNATAAGKTVRINSRTESTDTANSTIGFQSKIGRGLANANSIIGGEISPRVNSGIASGTIIGLHTDAYLKGTAAGTITGDVRAHNVELVTDDGGTRDITGNVSAIRVRTAFSAGTIDGKVSVLRVEKPETQTNSKNFDAVLELTGDNALIWRDDYTTEVTTLAGAIKVLVNGAVRYIPLYSGAPEV